MQRRLNAKWRPPLLLVLGGVLGAVLIAPLLGFVAIGLLRDPMGFRQAVVLVSSIVVLVTVVFAFLLWRLLLRPVTALERKADALRNGDASALSPLQQYGTRELHDLGQSVLAMAGTLHNREAAIRTYTNHVTHELKTPITAIRGAAELLAATQTPDSEDARLAQTVLDGTRRMERLLADLRDTAAAREPLHHGHSTLAQLRPQLAQKFPEMDLHFTGENIPLPLNSKGMRIVLLHLVQNAHEHGAQQVHFAASMDGGQVKIRISDTANGISEGNLPHIFDPFFTTKREKGGTGMGLSIVQNLIEAHGGQISVEQAEPTATFLVEFA